MARAHHTPIGVGKGQRAPPQSSPASVASYGQPSSQGDEEHIAAAAAHRLWRSKVAPDDVRTWSRERLLMYHTLYGTEVPAPPGFQSDHDQVPVSHGDTEELQSNPGAPAQLASTALNRMEQMVASSVPPMRAEPADGAGVRAATVTPARSSPAASLSDRSAVGSVAQSGMSLSPDGAAKGVTEIGRASCRERV